MMGGLGSRWSPVFVGFIGAVGITVVAACGSETPPGPLVDRIGDVVADLESRGDSAAEYVEVSATSEVVSAIVVGEGRTEQYFWTVDDGLTEPVPVASTERPTFTADEIDFRPDAVLAQVRSELPDSEIIDFAVTSTEGGVVVYDARLRSDRGGLLLVLLSRDGRILGVRAE